MIGYIPVRVIVYEDTDQGGLNPSPVYDSEAAAQACADEHMAEPDRMVEGDAWAVDLSTDPRIVGLIRVAHAAASNPYGDSGNALAGRAVLDALGPLTPPAWMRLVHPHSTIVDPDGWRGADAPSFDAPLLYTEFENRYTNSTIRSDCAPKFSGGSLALKLAGS